MRAAAKAKARKNKAHKAENEPTKKLHLDRRASDILAAAALPPPPADDDLLSTPELALMLGVSPQWVELARKRGYGPKFQKLTPRLVRYRRCDVLAWLEERTAMFAAKKGEKEAAHAA